MSAQPYVNESHAAASATVCPDVCKMVAELEPSQAEIIRQAYESVRLADSDAAEMRELFRLTVHALIEQGCSQSAIARALGLSRQRLSVITLKRVVATRP